MACRESEAHQDITSVVPTAQERAHGRDPACIRPVVNLGSSLSEVEPILHVSIPVRDPAEARRFYLDVLDCGPGRERTGWCDVWFSGMQITLHERPDEVLTDEQRGRRHFGVTLGTDELDRIAARVNKHDVGWLDPLCTEHTGTPTEHRKGKILDPSGNAIEIKAYIDREAAFAAAGRPSGCPLVTR